MKNKKIVLISMVALITIVFAVICFCVIVPQKTPATGSTYGSDTMIDQTIPEVRPTDKSESDAPNLSEDENDESITDDKNESNDSESGSQNEGSNQEPEIDDEQTQQPDNGENESNGSELSKPPADDEMSSSDGSSNAESESPFLQNLNFFVNEKTITKTKQVSGNVTTFEISFRVFVLNNSTGSKTISSNAFSADYFTGNEALYYTTVCDSKTSSIELDSYESADFGFTVKYIVIDTEKFDFNKTNNLVVSYMFNDVVSVNI